MALSIVIVLYVVQSGEGHVGVSCRARRAEFAVDIIVQVLKLPPFGFSNFKMFNSPFFIFLWWRYET